MIRRLSAIAVADVVGYARLMAADEAGTLAALRMRRLDIVEPEVRRHGGRIVKFMGDGALMEFPSAVNAVACALAIQRRMAAADEGVPEEKRICIRIGINLGEVIGEGADIFGDGVNIAARVEPLAEPGGIAVTAKVHDEVAGKIDAVFTSLGAHTLKNIPRAVEVYRVATGSPGETSAPARPPAKIETTVVAVLPFVNMSGDPAQDYFADGICEDLITELAREKHLSVIARNTTFVFKGKSVNVAETGRALGADFVVEGSIRLTGGRVRVTVQLIDVESGAHMFAERFDRSFDDIFAVQDEIVGAILARLTFNINDAAAAVRSRHPTRNASAYALWLKARMQWREGHEEESFALLCEAVTLDPGYARALADLGSLLAYRRFSHPSAARQTADELEARRLAEKAISLDRTDPYVLRHVASTWLLLGEAGKARPYALRALEIAPRDISAMMTLGSVLSYGGEHRAGRELLERARSLEPQTPPGFDVALGDSLVLEGNYEAALEAYGAQLDAAPYFRLSQAVCLAKLGRDSEAAALLRGLPRGFDVAAYARNTFSICARPEDAENWRDGFRRLGVDV